MTTMATPAMASAANTFKPFPSHVSSYDEEGMRERGQRAEKEKESREREQREREVTISFSKLHAGLVAIVSEVQNPKHCSYVCMDKF